MGSSLTNHDVLVHREVVVELDGLERPAETGPDPPVRREFFEALRAETNAPCMVGETRHGVH